MNFKSFTVAALSLSMGLAGMQGGALAQIQDAPIITGNVDGNCITSPSVNSSGANAGDWTITCGDLNPGAGTTVIAPPSAASEPAPVVAPEPAPVVAPEPVVEPAPVAEPAPETTETAPVETAVATESDLDADNYADALEADLGLDPANADTDADGVADGDEITLYGTEPTLFDTDGDGVSDGEELFGISTDPLVWNDFSDDASTQPLAQEATSAPAQSFQSGQDVVTLGQETTEDLSATNGAAATRGNGNASSAPGSVTRGGETVPSSTLLGPDGANTVTGNTPPTVSVSGTTSTPPVIVPAPGNDLAPEAVVDTVETAAPAETAAPVVTDTAVASETDLDADNYPDAAELEIGLDPNSPDTDGDGVADGDEVNIYLTDPFTLDTDGDGLSDGQELFATSSDPLVWDTNGNGISDGDELPA
jgi:hypothetical protein